LLTEIQPADTPSTEFDPSDYPRTYRASIGWLVYSLLLSGLGGALLIAGAWYFGTGHEMNGPGQAIAFSIACSMGALFCGFDMADTLTFTVTLYSDAIEVHRSWGKRTLRRAQIAGYPTTKSPRHPGLAPNTLVFPTRRPGTKSLNLPLVIRPDPPFLRWLASLSDVAAKTSPQTDSNP
jgi:hypothetical protein